jgi:hypothetical protein
MWMNEGDIEQMLDFTRYDAPEFAPYAQYLSDWKDVVNAGSDGWAYWKAGSGAAGKLMDALQALQNSHRYGDEAPDEDVFRKSLSPIRSCATKHRLQAPEFVPAQLGMKI